MAQPIQLHVPPRDPRAKLVARLQSAPVDHADALLAAYELLQGLHDRGVLDLARGALGSGDELAELAVDVARAPESIRALRNLLLLVNALAAIDPALLADVPRAVPSALAQASAEEARPPGLFKLLSTFLDKDFRRGLAAANDLFVALGRNLSARERA
jgi:uncharacterized protein YjgD (DUF1641 family)